MVSDGKPMPNPAQAYEGTAVLITGGAGCIGSNLTRRLAEAGAKRVVVLDDLSAAEPWNVPQHPVVRFVKGTILDDEVLRHVFREEPDYVFHLAAHFANQNSVDHPDTDLLVNGMGLLKVLQSSNRPSVKRFLYASSGCSVYGSEAPLPLTEEFVSLSLDTPYQITKLLGELYTNYFRNRFKLPIVNLRFFNVYGPGEIPGRYRNVIPNFFWWAGQRRALPITGTGEETRDFTYVDDIVGGIMAAGIKETAVGEAMNLASGVETRVQDLAENINRLTGNVAGIERAQRRDWDTHSRRRASIERARRLIGYEPRVTIEEGLRRTHDWFRNEHANIAGSVRF